MTVYVLALLIGAALVAGINYNQPRVIIWLAVGAVTFAGTYAYFFVAPWWLPHAAVTGAADLALALIIDTFRRERWEKWVYRCFMLSVLVSISMLFGWIPSQYVYGTTLEVCNWLALLVMGGIGIIRLVDEMDLGTRFGFNPRSWLHRARVFFEQESRAEGVLARTAAAWTGS